MKGLRDRDSTTSRGRRDRDSTTSRGRRDRDSTTSRGREGEELAVSILEAEGWKIIGRNYRGPHGEIDIIAAKGETLVFVEVKNWSVFDSGELGAAISARKARRIIETSKIFLSRNREYSDARLRYDVLLIREGRLERRIESAITGET